MKLAIAACVCAGVLISTTAHAQSSGAESSLGIVDWRAGGLVSLHPAGHANPPYLSHGLGGATIGLNAGFDLLLDDFWVFGIETNTTLPLRVEQTGRLASGPRGLTSLATHRDTLLSFLSGIRGGTRQSAFFLRAGASLLVGSTGRDGENVDEETSGRLALTFGADYSVQISETVSLSPFGRYSYAFRLDDARYFGLGPHIFRIGVDIRFIR